MEEDDVDEDDALEDAEDVASAERQENEVTVEEKSTQKRRLGEHELREECGHLKRTGRSAYIFRISSVALRSRVRLTASV